VEIGSVGLCSELGVPQPHVESRMLAAHEAGGADAMALAMRERQQRKRTVLGITGDHDEGTGAFLHPDRSLPGGEQVEPLVGCGEMAGRLGSAPDWVTPRAAAAE